MENLNYTTTIEVAKSPMDVFDHVNDVPNWWAKDAGEAFSGQKTEFKGQSTKLNDEFIVRSGDRHYSLQKLIEVIPDKKVVWQVTDCKMNWLENDKTEWMNTKMIFEIAPRGEKTILTFTHEGLVPEKECFANCQKGWDFFIKERLLTSITNNKTNTNMKKQEDFSYSFTVNASPKATMEKINQVNSWWAKNFKGEAGKVNDEFSVYFGNQGDTFVDFKISELIPEKKVVWLATDCNLHWINDKKEWKNNEMIWNLTEMSGKTTVDFIHKGMNAESECYESCKPGWTHHIKDSLVKLIEKGTGFPE